MFVRLSTRRPVNDFCTCWPFLGKGFTKYVDFYLQKKQLKEIGTFDIIE